MEKEGAPKKGERMRIYLSCEKACITIGKLIFEEGYSVHVGKITENGKRSQFFLEYWKE